MGILFKNIKGLVQVRSNQLGPVSGKAMAELPMLENAFLTVINGIIESFGPMAECPADTNYEVIDAVGRFLFPTFVDSHTHLVFAASREEEFEMKIKGLSYAEIAAKGGGILNSAKKLQAISEDELFERSLPRAFEVMASGTGAIEIKSGYGLTTKDELKMLRVARRIGRETPLMVKTTFLGAHAVPTSVSHDAYVDLVVKEMIPAVAEENLADYIDVFCEQGFFTVDETIRIGEAGRELGMKPRIHANQLHNSGGVQAGVQLNALSVDHLEQIGDAEIDCLKNSTTMPTALPWAAFFLGLPFPPARKIIDAGLPLAIATDFNPGSSPNGNMLHMISLACIKMKLTPAEAINAATVNTAFCLEILDSVGSITVGKRANLLLTKPIPSVAYMPYRFGANLVEAVFLNGRKVSYGGL